MTYQVSELPGCACAKFELHWCTATTAEPIAGGWCAWIRTNSPVENKLLLTDRIKAFSTVSCAIPNSSSNMASKTKEVNVKLDHITSRFLDHVIITISFLVLSLPLLFKLQPHKHGGNARPRASTNSKELLQYHNPSATLSLGALCDLVVLLWGMLCPACFLIWAMYKRHTAMLPLDHDLRRYRMLWTCVSKIPIFNT
jgi:hypothetical protein